MDASPRRVKNDRFLGGTHKWATSPESPASSASLADIDANDAGNAGDVVHASGTRGEMKGNVAGN